MTRAATPPTLPLGTPVTFDHALSRTDITNSKPHRREWQPYRAILRTGVIVGIRTLANGIVYWGSYDEPTEFHPTDYVRAYLVAFDLRRNPVHVQPEHVTILTEEHAA